MSPVALEKEDHIRDAEFNKAMHGKSANARGGMTAMLQKDKAAQQAAVDEYFKHWDNKAAADETEETRKVCLVAFLCVYPQLTPSGTTRRIRYPDQTLLQSCH